MGNAAPRAQPQPQLQDSAAQYRVYLADYAPLAQPLLFKDVIGDGKFLKAVRCTCHDGLLVVKIYRKIAPNEPLGNAEAALRRLSLAFSLELQPNLMPYANYRLSNKHHVAFMARQYFQSNLYDRVWSRPFLTPIEKKWIAFQILRAMEQAHARGVCHGDVKMENIMVTSWNWVFLTDFAPFKPTLLPDDDPADYNYYFCPTRRACCVAPERFYVRRKPGTNGGVVLLDSPVPSSNVGVVNGLGNVHKMPPVREWTNEAANEGLTLLYSEQDFAAPTPSSASTPASASPSPSSTTSSAAWSNDSNGRANGLKETMDIFSVGCVLAELFLGQKALFDLPSLLRYRTGDATHLKATIQKIEDPPIEEMLLHMLQLYPAARSSAREYLERYKSPRSGAPFPSYFDNFLFRFLVLVLSRNGKVPDARIRLVCKYYGRIVKEVANVDDPEGEQFFMMRLKEGFGSDRQFSNNSSADGSQDDNGHVAQRVLQELEQRQPSKPLAREKSDDSAAAIFSTVSVNAEKQKIDAMRNQYTALTERKKLALADDAFRSDSSAERRMPLPAALPKPSGSPADAKLAGGDESEPPFFDPRQPVPIDPANNGIVIIISLVCSSLRHALVPETKLTAIFLLRYLGQYTTDEIRLQRLLPFLLELLTDTSASVRALTVRTITYVLSLVRWFPLSDASIFPQYVFPFMLKLPSDDDELVRIAFAECLPLLASTSRRFLEIAHSLKQKNLGGSVTPSSTASTATSSSFSSWNSAGRTASTDSSLLLALSNFDKELDELHKVVLRFVMQIIGVDQPQTASPLVKRGLLRDITRLCIFFGRQQTVNEILPQLITFLNDSDWELRGAFFDHITGVCAFVGRVPVEQNVLPVIEMALIDVEEIVIAKAVECLGTLCQLGLFHKSKTALTHKAQITCSLLLHPSWCIRNGVFKLITVLAVQLGSVNANVFLGPILRPYLRKMMVFMEGDDEMAILERLKACCLPCITRLTFEAALVSSSHGAELSALLSSDLNHAGMNLDEQPVLELVEHYVQTASRHLRSKINILSQEQSARSQGTAMSLYSTSTDGGGINGSGAPRKLPRSSLHVLSVPDMRFALSIAQPLRSNTLNLAPSSAANNGRVALPPSSAAAVQLASVATNVENLSIASVAKMYGLVAPNLAQSVEIRKMPGVISPFDDPLPRNQVVLVQPSHFIANGAMISMLNHNANESVHGANNSPGTGADRLTPTMYSNSAAPSRPNRLATNMTSSSADPALSNPRKLLARLKALNVPPLPPDLGALRTDMSDEFFSIYAHSLSPQCMNEFAGSNNASGSSLLTDAAAPTSVHRGLGGSNPSLAYGHATSSFSIQSAPNGLGATTPAVGGMSTLAGSNGGNSRAFLYRNWRPRRNVLVAELDEHAGAVHRIDAAQDSSFLASASTDGTIKIWSVRSLQHSINQGSRCTYDAFPSNANAAITDMKVLDNSRSVAVASSTGSVQIVRVDRMGPNSANPSFRTSEVRALGVDSATATSTSIMALEHLNNVTESLLVYATRQGKVHAWDLRSRREAWTLDVSPELGFVTCLTHSLEGTWLAAGTSRGYLCVWDLHFLVLIRIWRHSSHRSIHRVLPCLSLPNTLQLEEPLVFIAAGDAEVGVFNINLGACRAVYRSVPSQMPASDIARCPALIHVAIPQRSRSVLGSVIGIYGISGAFDNIGTTPLGEEPSARAMVCPALHFRGVSDALITGGNDKQIRYWDMRNGENSFTICGDDDAKPIYDAISPPSDWWRLSSATANGGTTSDHNNSLVSAATMLSMSTASSLLLKKHKSGGLSSPQPVTPTASASITKPEMAWSQLSPPIVTVCQDATNFASQGGLGAGLASGGSSIENVLAMERRGLVAPSVAHTDCVLDLALVDLNGPMLVSSGRDGIIKVWK